MRSGLRTSSWSGLGLVDYFSEEQTTFGSGRKSENKNIDSSNSMRPVKVKIMQKSLLGQNFPQETVSSSTNLPCFPVFLIHFDSTNLFEQKSISCCSTHESYQSYMNETQLFLYQFHIKGLAVKPFNVKESRKCQVFHVKEDSLSTLQTHFTST